MTAENYYEVLGLRPGVDDEKVKQAFRELAKVLHPDRNLGDPDAGRRFALVNTAYEALKDESRRRAYDEWLAFAKRHERSRSAQWGRLAAMAAMLLIGPSLALYWAFTLLHTWDKPADKRPQVTAAAPPPKPLASPDNRDTTVQTAFETKTGSQTRPAAVNTPSRPETDGIREANKLDDATKPPALPAVARSAPVPAPVSTPVTPDVPAVAAPPSDEPTAVTPAARAPTPRPGPQSTASLPLSVPDVPAKSNERAKVSPSQPAITSIQQDRSARESMSRSMARLIAEAKEPMPGELRRPPAERAQQQAVIQPGGEPRQAPAAPLYESDEFSDCNNCPVMSMVAAEDIAAPSARAARPRRSLAISKSQVSVAQWNACVQDGGCGGMFKAAAGSADQPVRDVSRVEAARYAEWLTRKTGRSYRVMKFGGWDRPGKPGERSDAWPEADASACSTTEWNAVEDPACARERLGARSPETTVERTQLGATAPFETTSGFRVSRTLAPDG